MENRGIKADFALYKSLMIGCCKNNQMEMAFKVYQNMRRSGITSTDVYRLDKKGGAKKGKTLSFERNSIDLSSEDCMEEFR